MKTSSKERALIDEAITARQTAYAPYSRFRVGVALQLRNGQVVSGVNVENVSYGLTVCAERNAIAAAVRAGATPGDVMTVAIAADADTPTSPCGACRQVLLEFGVPDTAVLLHNVRDGKLERMSLGELLPRFFAKASLPKA